jgi:hypothetical protein
MTDDDQRMEREIRKIAYEIWDSAGRPEGKDREHWEAAKERWAFQQQDRTAEPAETPNPAPRRAPPKQASHPAP